MNNYSWVNVIPSLLEYVNGLFDTSKKKNVLVLEGPKDLETYRNLLNGNLNIDGKQLSLKMDDEQFFPDPLSPDDSESIFELGEIYNPRQQKLQKLKDSFKDSNDYKQFKKYNYVIEIIKAFKNGKYDNIDCYGFIDQDFGHDYDKSLPISITSMHDLETNIYRCYLPFLSKDNAILNNNHFHNIIRFAFLQGLLEKSSIVFNRDNEFYEELMNHKIKDITNFCFSDMVSDNKFNVDSFDFDNYLLERVKKLDKFTTQPAMNKIIKIYKEFKTNYRDLIVGMDDLVDRWIEGKEIDKGVDTIFSVSNGHILSGLLIKELDNINSEDEIVNLLINSYARKNLEIIFEINPLNDYLRFLIDNKYIAV